MSDELIRQLRSGRSNNSLIETVGGCQHYISCLKAADTIETLHAKIAELQADVETLQADVALSDVCCLDYKKHIAELEEKITRYKERYHNTRHENTRLDAALAGIKILAESGEPWSKAIPAIITKVDKARAGQ